MNYKKLLSEVATKSQVDATVVDTVLNTMFASMYDTLAQGDTLSVYSFGTFSLKQKQSWRMYNPKTQKTTVVPEREDLAVHVSPAYKDKCNS